MMHQGEEVQNGLFSNGTNDLQLFKPDHPLREETHFYCLRSSPRHF